MAFWSATAESGEEKKEEEEEEEEDMDGEEEEEHEEEEEEGEEEKEEEEEGRGGEMEVVEEEGADILPSLLHASQTNRVNEAPEQLCVARGNQQNTEERRDLHAENPEQEESPLDEDGDHEMDSSNLGAKTADDFTNKGHISDEEDPADSSTNERGKYLTDGDAPTESPANNEGSPAQAGHVHSGIVEVETSYNLGADKESRSLESGGGNDKGGVGSSGGLPGVSSASTRAKLLSRKELVDLFMEISPVKGKYRLLTTSSS